MRRRTFLQTGVVAASALAAWFFFFRADPEDVIQMVLHRRLDYLMLDPEGVQRFAKDMAALQLVSKLRMRILAMISPLYTRFPLSDGRNTLAHQLRHGEDRIVSAYLISTDFFLNGADESRLVKYLGLLDPLHACANPFARRVT